MQLIWPRAPLRTALWSILPAILLISGAEFILRFAGLRPFPFAGISSPTYWVHANNPDGTEGYIRARPRPYKVVPEPIPLFLKNKPKNGFRVFCLGDSPIYGWPYDVGSCCDWLQSRLGAIMPDRFVEVINGANPGWNATETRDLLKECLSLSPDAIIWMMGDSEYTPENVALTREDAGSRMEMAARSFLLDLSIIHALGRVVPGLERQRAYLAETPNDSANVAEFPENDNIKKRYIAAIEGGVADARAAGAAIFLCTPPRNYRGLAPRSSIFSRNVQDRPDLISKFNQDVSQAANDLDRKQYKSALEKLDRALTIDTNPARLHYFRARALEGLDKKDQARVEYQKALELDGSPGRPKEWMLTEIRRIGNDTNTPVFDIEQLLNSKSPLNLAGPELMLDSLHPNQRGQEHMGALFVEQVPKLLNLKVDWTLDPKRITGKRGEELARVNSYDSARYQCTSKLQNALTLNANDAAFKAVRAAGQQVLETAPDDYEIVAACAFLDAVAGAKPRARKALLRAANKDTGVRLEIITKYRTSELHKSILDNIDFPISQLETGLTAAEKVVLENRMARARTK